MPTFFAAQSDPILGGLFNTVPFSGMYIMIWFAFFAILILVCAKRLSTILDLLSKKTRLSSGFLGGVLLSITTSIPEMIAAVFAGLRNDVSFGVDNVLGANMITTAVISIFSLLLLSGWMINKQRFSARILFFKNVTSSNIYLIRRSFIVNVCFLASLLIVNATRMLFIPVARLSLVSFVPVVFYAIFFYQSITSKNNTHPESQLKQALQSGPRPGRLFISLLLFSLLLIVCAYFNSAIAHLLPERSNGALSENTSAGVLLALSGALPEITTFMFLAAKGQVAIATSGIVGSHLFNLSLVFLTDVISYVSPNGTFGALTENAGFTSAYAVNYVRPLLWAAASTAISGLLMVQTFKRVNESPYKTYIISFAIVGFYVTGYLLSNGAAI